MNEDDFQIYVQSGDEKAFERLMTRYLPLVHSAALRLVNGDVHLARDIAQMVFVNFAAKAKNIPQRTILVGWLHQDTRFTALQVLRKESRRRDREAEAGRLMEESKAEAEWEQMCPVLDEALGALPTEQRTVLLLRFFQRLSVKEVGEQLGVGESGASRRISGAVEDLRRLLRKEGVTVSSAGLAALLAARSVDALSAAEVAILIAGVKSVVPPMAAGLGAAGSIILMTTNAKVLISGALICAALVGSLAIKRARQTATDKKPDAAQNTSQALAKGGIQTVAKRAGEVQPAQAEPEVDARIERVRSILYAKGRTNYPPPDLNAALEALQPNRKLALPLLMEALRSNSLEARRRALAGIMILNGDAREAIPVIIDLLRQSDDETEGLLAVNALESMGSNPEIVSDLAEVMKQNPKVRMNVANAISSFVQPGTEEAMRAADFFRPLLNDPDESLAGEAARILATLSDKIDQRHILEVALSGLKSADADAQVRGLTTLANMSDAVTNALPDLRRYLATAARPDLKIAAEKMLKKLDPSYADQTASPQFAQDQQERAARLAARIENGTATDDEIIQGLAGGSQSILVASRALAAKNFEKWSADNRDKLFQAVTALSVISQGEQPLEVRLAAARAFAALQPMRPRPIYSAEELTGAFDTLRSELNAAPASTHDAGQRAFDGSLDVARTISRNPAGPLTDYPTHILVTLARELKNISPDLAVKFEGEMRKIDPQFRTQ